MLQSIRDNSQGIVAKIIVGLIAVTFALFGVESLVSLTASSNAPATVNGEEISPQELHQGVQLQRRQILNQMGENADPTLLDDNLISDMVLENLIEQSVLVQSASNQGLVFSDAMIDQMIVASPEFQVDGKFNRAQFEITLRNAGFTPLTYRSLLRKEKISEQERIAYMLSAFTLDNELQNIANLDQQTRDIRYFTLNADQLRATTTVSDEEVTDYYQQNSSQFMTEEQVEIEYLLLDRNELAKEITISVDDLETGYQTLVDNYQAQEQRHAAHILVEISEQQDSAAALAKAEKIAGQIESGESFETLAQSESDDPVSAEMGGDLGINEKGVFSPEFEDVLYALEKGQVSEPVKTEFGYHLIKLIDVLETTVPSFEEAKIDLEADLIKQKSEEEYVTQLEQLADISFSSGDLAEPSEALGLAITKTDPFGRSGTEDEITSNPRVLAVAFDQELIKEGLNSTPIELDSGRSVVLRNVAHHEPREKSKGEVAGQITALLINEKVSTALTTSAADKIDQLNQGADITTVLGVAELKTVTGLSRRSSDVAQEINVAVFKMPKPEEGSSSYKHVELLDGSVAVIALDAVANSTTVLKEEDKRMMAMVLGNRSGQQDYQDFVQHIKNKAEIEKL